MRSKPHVAVGAANRYSCAGATNRYSCVGASAATVAWARLFDTTCNVTIAKFVAIFGQRGKNNAVLQQKCVYDTVKKLGTHVLLKKNTVSVNVLIC